MMLLHFIQKCFDCLRIKMRTGLLGDILDGFLRTPGRAVRAIGCQCISYIYDREEARPQRDVLLFQPPRIAGTIPAFVMTVWNFQRRPEVFNR